MALFSERMGLARTRHDFQLKALDQSTRNSIWNIFQPLMSGSSSAYRLHNPTSLLGRLMIALYRDLFKIPIDEISANNQANVNWIKSLLTERNKLTWDKYYDLLEFIAAFYGNPVFESQINEVFTREKVGYRMVSFQLTQITSEVELECLEESLSMTDRFSPVSTHLNEALVCLNRRPEPDYRNSIKESISAVESMVVIINGKKGTLGDALKKIEGLHPALAGGFGKLYGYTSNADGIRHAIIEDGKPLTFADAKYMLVSCSAFVNYLKEKSLNSFE